MPKETLILVLAGLALLVSCYISYKKNKKEKIVCYIGQDCNKVLNSKYNKMFLGIPNEIVGLFYFGLMFLISLAFIIWPQFAGSQLILARQVIAGISALASLGFTFIQLSVLKEFCEHCTVVNIINILIFVFLVFF